MEYIDSRTWRCYSNDISASYATGCYRIELCWNNIHIQSATVSMQFVAPASTMFTLVIISSALLDGHFARVFAGPRAGTGPIGKGNVRNSMNYCGMHIYMSSYRHPQTATINTLMYDVRKTTTIVANAVLTASA